MLSENMKATISKKYVMKQILDTLLACVTFWKEGYKYVFIYLFILFIPSYYTNPILNIYLKELHEQRTFNKVKL